MVRLVATAVARPVEHLVGGRAPLREGRHQSQMDDGSLGWIIGLTVAATLLLLAGFIAYYRRRGRDYSYLRRGRTRNKLPTEVRVTHPHGEDEPLLTADHFEVEEDKAHLRATDDNHAPNKEDLIEMIRHKI